MKTTAWAFCAVALLRVPTLAQCCGDCGGDGIVTVNEIITAVNNALGQCPAAPTGLTGRWDGNSVSAVTQYVAGFAADLTQSGANVDGALYIYRAACTYPTLAVAATLDGDLFRGSASATGVRVDFAARLFGRGMSGGYEVTVDGPCEGDFGSFAMTR